MNIEFSKSFHGPYASISDPEKFFQDFADEYEKSGTGDFADEVNGIIRFARINDRIFILILTPAVHGEDAQVKFELYEIEDADGMDPVNMFAGDSISDILTQVANSPF